RCCVCDVTMSATAVNNTVAAAVCPDGKLDVAGVSFKRVTAGRGRPTANVVERNTLISSVIAIAMTLASRHHRSSAKHATSTTIAMTTGSVFNADVATLVTPFHEPVRC